MGLSPAARTSFPSSRWAPCLTGRSFETQSGWQAGSQAGAKSSRRREGEGVVFPAGAATAYYAWTMSLKQPHPVFPFRVSSLVRETGEKERGKLINRNARHALAARPGIMRKKQENERGEGRKMMMRAVGKGVRESDAKSVILIPFVLPSGRVMLVSVLLSLSLLSHIHTRSHKAVDDVHDDNEGSGSS